MTKGEFLAQLRARLSGLPPKDAEERLIFYSEMIDDRIEEGLSEEEAVAAIGTVNAVVKQIIAETPLTKIAKERIKPVRRLKAWEIVLIALGSPIWVSLGIAVVSVIFSLYISLWSVIVSLWAVFGSLIGCSFGFIVTGAVLAIIGNTASGVALIGAGLILAGLSIFMFFGCKAATSGIILLTKKFAIWLKSCFIKKEAA